MNQNILTRLEVSTEEEGLKGRKEILWEAGGLSPGEVVRLAYEMGGQYDNILRIRAAACKTEHRVTDFPLSYVCADASYNSSELDTQDG